MDMKFIDVFCGFLGFFYDVWVFRELLLFVDVERNRVLLFFGNFYLIGDVVYLFKLWIFIFVKILIV